MADVKFKPIRHDHKAFLAKASKRKGFVEAYDALALEYELAGQMLKARARAGLTQDAVAERMGTTQSVISRLEEGGGAKNRLDTLARVAVALDRHLVVSFPEKVPAHIKNGVQVA